MKIKAIVLTGLVGSTLLLTGCGGGGGGGSSAATAIDGFNMTQGTADTKLGATYVQEFLTANNAVSTTVSDIYSRLNVPGVEQAHLDGWTGKGKTIAIFDNAFSAGTHGERVRDIAENVAPGATITEYTNQTVTTEILSNDVITTSIDGASASRADTLKGSNALVTIAAQHTNGVGEGKANMATCNVASRTVKDCNTWAAAGLDGINVIYVGEIDGSSNIPSVSNQAGDTHKNQFLVTSSDYITTASDGGTHGNSYAAPRVAGAGALVRHKFPNLSGAQTATTILHTADDLGVAGVDAVYGHGKLNVGKALAPVGNLH